MRPSTWRSLPTGRSSRWLGSWEIGTPHKAGKAMHPGLGIMPGALYGALRKQVPAVCAGHGLGMFVMEDEIANPLLGNTSGPMAYPWQAHWRGLVTHLVLGAVTETVIGALDQATGTEGSFA